MAWRTARLAIRIRPDIKAAAELAARDDQCSLSAYVEKLLHDRLTAQSYLTAVKQQELPGIPNLARRG